MEPITDEQKIVVDMTLLQIAKWIESRKLDPTFNAPLIPDAVAGFNLACEFLSHELRRMRELNNWSKESGYKTVYTFHKDKAE